MQRPGLPLKRVAQGNFASYRVDPTGLQNRFAARHLGHCCSKRLAVRMAANGDPFPASLPGFPAGIYDSEMGGTEQEQEYGFFTSAIGQDSPGHFFQEDALLDSPYQSPMPVKPNAPENIQVSNEPQFSASPPDSSLQDSSSDSSGRVKRKTSSRSSHSGLATDAMVPGGPNANVQPGHIFPGWKAPPNPTSFDFNDRNMESDFDFNSAASSPSPITRTQQHPAPYSGPRHIAMPFRATPRTSHRGLPHLNGGRSVGSNVSSPVQQRLTTKIASPGHLTIVQVYTRQARVLAVFT